jgi:hypothetical protein
MSARNEIKKCIVKGCKNPLDGRIRCAYHKEKVRKQQLATAMKRHRNRLKRGQEVETHLLYDKKPTSWALQHPREALTLARKNPRLVVPIDQFKKMLALGRARS